MKEEFDLKKLLVMAAFVAVIGGILSMLLGIFITPLASIWGGILASIIALVLLIVMIAKTDLEGYDVIELMALFLTIAIVGGIVVLIVPAAAAFIFVPSGALTITGFVWSLVYIGAAMIVRKAIGH